MIKTCLVIGGNGFIGSHLVNELIRVGHQVVIVDDMSSGKNENVENLNKCKLIINTIQEVANEDLKGIDGVFHLAAQASVPISIDDFYKSSQNRFYSIFHNIGLRNSPHPIKMPKRGFYCRCVRKDKST